MSVPFLVAAGVGFALLLAVILGTNGEARRPRAKRDRVGGHVHGDGGGGRRADEDGDSDGGVADSGGGDGSGGGE